MLVIALGAARVFAETSGQATPDPAEVLRARFAALSEQLAHSPIQQDLYLESTEGPRTSLGDLYAVVPYPFDRVSGAFARPENWCEALILHLNVKYCRAVDDDGRTVLSIALGKKTEQPLKETHRFRFGYNVTTSAADYAAIDLDAREGPLGTRDYHLTLELIALEDARSFLHIRYSYSYGVMGRLAMRFYLATSGRRKVGFTILGEEKGSPGHLVGGMRGALERNTMRYYLALDAFLGAMALPDSQRFEQSIETWYAATERFALQLHEVDHDAYVTMKRHEYLRQQP